jgi:hypothetical protein
MLDEAIALHMKMEVIFATGYQRPGGHSGELEATYRSVRMLDLQTF